MLVTVIYVKDVIYNLLFVSDLVNSGVEEEDITGWDTWDNDIIGADVVTNIEANIDSWLLWTELDNSGADNIGTSSVLDEFNATNVDDVKKVVEGCIEEVISFWVLRNTVLISVIDGWVVTTTPEDFEIKREVCIEVEIANWILVDVAIEVCSEVVIAWWVLVDVTTTIELPGTTCDADEVLEDEEVITRWLLVDEAEQERERELEFKQLNTLRKMKNAIISRIQAII